MPCLGYLEETEIARHALACNAKSECSDTPQKSHHQMACVIHFVGDLVDVEALQRLCPTPPCSVFQKGLPRSNRPGARAARTSGLSVVASEADFDLLEDQQKEALEFLQKHHSALLAMRQTPGIEFASIDFGISMRNVIVQSDIFESQLLAALAELNLQLVLSQYPTAGKDKKLKQYRRSLRRGSA